VAVEVAEERGEVNARKFGRWLGSNALRVSHGLRLEPGDKSTHGVPWRVVKVE
jgi:hypothetical protein